MSRDLRPDNGEASRPVIQSRRYTPNLGVHALAPPRPAGTAPSAARTQHARFLGEAAEQAAQ